MIWLVLLRVLYFTNCRFGHMEGLYGEQQVQHDIVSILFNQRNHDLTIQEKSKHTKKAQ